MVRHTKDYLMSYMAETNYAGGNGGAEYAATPVGAADKLLLSAFHIPASITFPYRTYMRERLQLAGLDPNDNVEFEKGYELIDGEFEFYTLKDTWLDAAILDDPTAAGKSYVIHIEDGEDYFDAVGCTVKTWAFSAASDDYPKETVTFAHYDVVDGVAVTDHATTVPFDTTQPEVFADIGLSVGGNAISDIVSVSATIENDVLDNDISGKYQHTKHELQGRTSSVEVTFHTDTADNLIYDPREALDTHAVVLTRGTTAKALTISSMSVVDSNVNEIPEFGIFEHSITLENSGSCTYSTA